MERPIPIIIMIPNTTATIKFCPASAPFLISGFVVLVEDFARFRGVSGIFSSIEKFEVV